MLFPKDKFIICPYENCEELINDINEDDNRVSSKNKKHKKNDKDNNDTEVDNDKWNMVKCHFDHIFCKLCRIKEIHRFDECKEVNIIQYYH